MFAIAIEEIKPLCSVLSHDGSAEVFWVTAGMKALLIGSV